MDGLNKLYGINQGFRKVSEFPSEQMMNGFPFYRQTAQPQNFPQYSFWQHDHPLDWSN